MVQPLWWSKAVQLAVRVKTKAEDLSATVAAAVLMPVTCYEWWLQAVGTICLAVLSVVAKALVVDGDSLNLAACRWLCCGNGDGCGHGVEGQAACRCWCRES